MSRYSAPSQKVRAWSGEYDRRVTIYYNLAARTANADGQRPESETEYCKRWCSVIPRSAVERFMSRQMKDDVTHVVRMRRDSETKLITSAYWFDLSDGTRMNIVSGPFDVDGRQIEIMFDVVERRAT